jgi:hypothetical protein
MDEVTEDIFRFFYQTREFIDRARSGGMPPIHLHFGVTRYQAWRTTHTTSSLAGLYTTYIRVCQAVMCWCIARRGAPARPPS